MRIVVVGSVNPDIVTRVRGLPGPGQAPALLSADGVDLTAGRRMPDLPTGHALITLDDDGETTIVVAVGADAAPVVEPADVTVALLSGRSDAEALRHACAAGALAVSRAGAQPSVPTAAGPAAVP